VDDVLVISHDATKTMTALSKLFRLKDGFAPPTRYLGATIQHWRLPGDEAATHWGHSSEEYVKQVLLNVEQELLKTGNRLNGRFSTPMSADYRPELDYSPFLEDAGVNYYMELIGILHWIVELGRIDIMVAVLMLSSYSMQPRIGHLDQVFHIFGYLKCNCRATLMFDETRAEWDENSFRKHSIKCHSIKCPKAYWQSGTNQLFCGCRSCRQLNHQKISDRYIDLSLLGTHPVVLQVSEHG